MAPSGGHSALERSSGVSASTEKLLSIEVDPNGATRSPLGVPLGSGVTATWRAFAVSPWAFVSAGHHDNTAVVCAFDSNHNHPVQIQTLVGHKELVTAVDMDADYIVTGSRDLTLLLWAIISGADGSVRFRVAEAPRGVYYGHDSEVTCVCVSAGLDLVVSGARDGAVLMHELGSRRLIRCLVPPAKASDSAVGVVKVSTRGDVFVYTRAHRMFVFSQGGRCLAREEADRVTCAALTRNGEFVVTGSADCCITVRALATLQVVQRLRTSSVILSIALTTDEHSILCGLENGKIAIVSGDASGKRLLK
jgi:WD40 repeat protein